MQDNLSQQISSKPELRQLATHGLDFKQNVITTALSDNKDDINGAGLTLINKWSSKYEDKYQAYDDLCQILRKTNRASWINELGED